MDVSLLKQNLLHKVKREQLWEEFTVQCGGALLLLAAWDIWREDFSARGVIGSSTVFFRNTYGSHTCAYIHRYEHTHTSYLYEHF